MARASSRRHKALPAPLLPSTKPVTIRSESSAACSRSIKRRVASKASSTSARRPYEISAAASIPDTAASVPRATAPASSERTDKGRIDDRRCKRGDEGGLLEVVNRLLGGVDELGNRRAGIQSLHS